VRYCLQTKVISDEMNVKKMKPRGGGAAWGLGPVSHRLGVIGWGLILTSPLLLLCVMRARARRWLLRLTLSVCFPILKAFARASGLVKASEWDPNARTIEDPVRCTREIQETLRHTSLHGERENVLLPCVCVFLSISSSTNAKRMPKQLGCFFNVTAS
jgi:hypothetical protein